MPIQRINLSAKPGHLEQVCAGCGATHRISLDRGAVKAKTGPIALSLGATLMVAVDGGLPQTVTVGAGDLPDLARVTAAELAGFVGKALQGVLTSDDAGGLLLESASTGADSRIEVVSGTARAALGLPIDGPADPCPGRPVLGVSVGEQPNSNVIALRRCNDCGSHECLVRTVDTAPAELAGTHHYEHRRAVNTLAEHCKASGWSHPALAGEHAAETSRPVDLHAEIPLLLEIPPVPGTRAAGAGRQP